MATGQTGSFEVLSIDIPQKRIGLAMVDEHSTRAGATPSAQDTIVPGAIVGGKVERHERFGVFVFLSPGKSGLIPFSETGVDRVYSPQLDAVYECRSNRATVFG